VSQVRPNIQTGITCAQKPHRFPRPPAFATQPAFVAPGPAIPRLLTSHIAQSLALTTRSGETDNDASGSTLDGARLGGSPYPRASPAMVQHRTYDSALYRLHSAFHFADFAHPTVHGMASRKGPSKHSLPLASVPLLVVHSLLQIRVFFSQSLRCTRNDATFRNPVAREIPVSSHLCHLPLRRAILPPHPLRLNMHAPEG
jgi:hypothetical protein